MGRVLRRNRQGIHEPYVGVRADARPGVLALASRLQEPGAMYTGGRLGGCGKSGTFGRHGPGTPRQRQQPRKSLGCAAERTLSAIDAGAYGRARPPAPGPALTAPNPCIEGPGERRPAVASRMPSPPDWPSATRGFEGAPPGVRAEKSAGGAWSGVSCRESDAIANGMRGLCSASPPGPGRNSVAAGLVAPGNHPRPLEPHPHGPVFPAHPR